MKHSTIFQGIATALATPMTAFGVDYDALGRLIDFQLENGINALVAVGTTGESATLTPAERNEIIRFTVERVNGRVPVIAGTGTNSTIHALEYSKTACQIGADALLVVTPYYNYNKSLDSGLLAHFRTIADSVDKPIILYNVPSRTGCNLLPATVEKLAEHPNIAAIKEASGNMSQVVDLVARCGDKLDIYSGEDALTVPILSMGGKGAISVLSNVAPRQTVDMTDAFFAGHLAEAAKMQCRYLPLIHDLFCEANPIPVKAAITAMGFGEEHIRLPLVPMQEDNRQRMLMHMRQLGVNV